MITHRFKRFSSRSKIPAGTDDRLFWLRDLSHTVQLLKIMRYTSYKKLQLVTDNRVTSQYNSMPPTSILRYDFIVERKIYLRIHRCALTDISSSITCQIPPTLDDSVCYHRCICVRRGGTANVRQGKLRKGQDL